MELVRICYEKNIPQTEINEFLNKGFNKNQIQEITSGLKNKLTIDEIKIFANPNIEYYKMHQIRLGLEHKLTIDEIKLYTKPEYNFRHMAQIRLSIEAKLPKEQIDFIANLKNSNDMHLARVCYENKVPQKEIDDLLSKNFDKMKIYEICTGLENGLTIDQVKTYANPEYDWSKMHYSRERLERTREQNISTDKLNEKTEIQNLQEYERSLDDEIKSLEEEQPQTEPIEIDEAQTLDDLIANTPADESIGQNTDNGPSFDDE